MSAALKMVINNNCYSCTSLLQEQYQLINLDLCKSLGRDILGSDGYPPVVRGDNCTGHCSNNSNDTTQDNKKKKPKKCHVSFNGNKDAHRTNSRKQVQKRSEKFESCLDFSLTSKPLSASMHSMCLEIHPRMSTFPTLPTKPSMA